MPDHTQQVIEMKKLEGKVAIVTGASKGIGAAIARSLGAAGASVVVNYASSRAGADAVVNDIVKAGGKAIAVGGDVSVNAEAQHLVASAVDTYKRLDILVNNAGVYAFAPVDQITEEDFHRHFNINVLGVLLATQAAAKHLGAGSSIINIGSNASALTPPGSVIYTGTKGALDAITGVLAKELGPRGVRVNSINPGLVVTEGTTSGGHLGSEFEASHAALSPLGRIGKPEDVATIATFLASEDAGWLTGEILLASGGVH